MQGTVQCPLKHSPCPAGFPGTTWPVGVGEVLVGECQREPGMAAPGAEALSPGGAELGLAFPLLWVDALKVAEEESPVWGAEKNS